MSVLLQLFKADDHQSRFFSGFQPNQRRDAVLIGLFPTGCTDTPVITRFQPWKLKCWHWSREVVALGLAVAEELFGHHAADAVLAEIRRVGLAKAVAIPTRHRLTTANF